MLIFACRRYSARNQISQLRQPYFAICFMYNINVAFDVASTYFHKKANESLADFSQYFDVMRCTASEAGGANFSLRETGLVHRTDSCLQRRTTPL
ncbi:hypothetical protein Y032_0769g2205 [Ancylostoma ceylanicum]|nr:hypothetical protein Y032_0769g2205 [Ancylostoma ceylanicum]